MLVDLVLFNDEVDILTFRIRYLSGIVDRFVIAQSETSFSGIKKPVFAEKVKTKFPELKNRIKIINYSFPAQILDNVDRDRLPLEFYARTILQDYVLSSKEDFFVIFSDVDEIPSLEQLLDYRTFTNGMSLLSPCYYRYANWSVPHSKFWNTIKVLPRDMATNLNEIRYSTALNISTESPGAHFSYLKSDWNSVKNKLDSFSDMKFQANADLVKEIMQIADEYTLDHLGRFRRLDFGLLKVQDQSDLTPLQSAFMEQFPSYFNFKPKKHFWMIRVFFSFYITELWRYNQHSTRRIREPKVSVSLFAKFVFALLFSAPRRIKPILKHLVRTKIYSLK